MIILFRDQKDADTARNIYSPIGTVMRSHSPGATTKTYFWRTFVLVLPEDYTEDYVYKDSILHYHNIKVQCVNLNRNNGNAVIYTLNPEDWVMLSNLNIFRYLRSSELKMKAKMST